MNNKKILKIMRQKEEDENNNHSFFGGTGLQVIVKDNLEIIGRYCPELKVLWIYPDKIYKDVYSISDAYKLSGLLKT